MAGLACLAVACGGEPLRPAIAAPHILNGTWIGASVDYSLNLTLQVKDSVRVQPLGEIKTKFVSGVGRYANLKTGAESTFAVPPYEVGFQQQLEPMTLNLWILTAAGSQITFRFRGQFLGVNAIPGWLIREQQPAGMALVTDSATLTLNRDR